MHTIDNTALQIPEHLLKSLEQGETIVVSKGSHPLAFLVPAQAPASKRPIGLAKGEFSVPDDFNQPDPEIEALFYGKE